MFVMSFLSSSCGVWVLHTLFDLCPLCSLCLSCNLPTLLALFWLSYRLVNLCDSIHAYHLMHACHSFLANHSVLASHFIPAFHLGHAHLFNYASLMIMVVICFMLVLQFCSSFRSCLLFCSSACCVLRIHSLFHPCHLIFDHGLVCQFAFVTLFLLVIWFVLDNIIPFAFAAYIHHACHLYYVNHIINPSYTQGGQVDPPKVFPR